MELGEFKGEMLCLLGVESVGDIGNALMTAVISHNTLLFDAYKEMATDANRDYLQSLWQYYEADRTEKKQDYTPISLCRLVASLAGTGKTVYDCCGGSGALSAQLQKDSERTHFQIEELDENVIPFLLFNLCINNISATVRQCNVLTREVQKEYNLMSGMRYSTAVASEITDIKKCDVAVSNPPYNIRTDTAKRNFPVHVSTSNANFAFVFQCLENADRAVVILPPGAATERTETRIRKYLIENDYVESVIIMPNKMFEGTSIPTCIFVLDKHKDEQHKGKIVFVNSKKNCVPEQREQRGQFGGATKENRVYKKQFNCLSTENIVKIMCAVKNLQIEKTFSAVVKNEDVNEEYILAPSRYIEDFEDKPQHRPFKDIASDINYIQKMQNSVKLVINETIAKRLGLKQEIFEKNIEEPGVNSLLCGLGCELIKNDYIQFTKNKGEFVFKANDKDICPDMFIQFFNVWKNQIALLNTMQNKYLIELRDALLPELMNGDIELQTSTEEHNDN